MITVAAVPFLAAVALRLGAAPVTRRLSPAAATWLLTICTFSVSLACGLVLAVASYVSLAQLSVVARMGHWSTAALRRAGSLPVPVGAVLAVLVLGLLGAALARLALTVRALVSAHHTLGRLPRSDSSLVVVDSPVPSAFAVAGRTGRIVVSAGMLGALSADERRVLLAHEEAHLRYRHHVFAWVTAIAAAANPLLGPIVGLVRASTERWADEVAVHQVGDRGLVARGLARAALVRAGAQAVPGAIGIADGDVVARVRALLDPAPSTRRAVAGLLITGTAVLWLATALVLFKEHGIIELGELAYRR